MLPHVRSRPLPQLPQLRVCLTTLLVRTVQVNATGVMPVIFSSTLMSLPTGLARYAPWLEPVAAALGPTGLLYLPVRAHRPPFSLPDHLCTLPAMSPAT